MHRNGTSLPGTHVSLQVVVLDIRLDSNYITKHSRHEVFSEDHDLLLKELDTAWIGREFNVGYAILQTGYEGRENWFTG